MHFKASPLDVHEIAIINRYSDQPLKVFLSAASKGTKDQGDKKYLLCSLNLIS